MGESVERSLIWLSSGVCADSACLQVALSGDQVLIRSSLRPDEVTSVTRAEWEAFRAGVEKEEFHF